MTPPQARFGGIDIVTKDMAASLDFYRAMGIDIPDDKIWSDDGAPQHVDLKLRAATSGFDIDSEELTVGYDPAWTRARWRRGVLIFRADSRDDVDALHDHLVSLGHPSHLAPLDAFWGARFAIVVDPDGNHVSLMSPIDKARAASPPDA